MEGEAPRPADAEGSIKAGWLNKKGKLNRSFQHRYFVLWHQEELWVAGQQVEAESFKLGYYKDAKAAEPNGLILLQQAQYTVAEPSTVTKGQEHGLVLDGLQDGKRKHFTLSADTEAEQQEWISTIRGLKFGVPPPSSVPEAVPPEQGATTPRVGKKEAKKNAAASSMVGSIFELLDSDKDGFLNYTDFAGLGRCRDTPLTLKFYLDLVQTVDGDVDTGLSEQMLADCYFHHSLGDCVADFERLIKLSGEHGKKHRQKLKRKSGGGGAGAAGKGPPRKQLDLGSLKPEELEEQRKMLEGRVLEWLGDIPIGGAEERHYDPRPMCRFAESWNLFHLDVEDIYARQIDEQMAEAEVEAMVGSGRRRGEAMVDLGEKEEGRLLTLLIQANELVASDKKMYITAKDLERLLFHLRDRLGLPTEEDIFVTMESGAELLKLDDLDDTCSIKVWSRKQAEEDQARMSRSANTPDGSRGGGGGGGGGSLLEEDDSSEEDEYEADPVASKAKLVEAAKVLWEAKYDADYKRGTALIVEASRLDKSALQARKMVEVAQRDGGGGASSVEMRVEALFICLETDPESMEGEAAKLAAECMKLGNELLAIFEVTRDKEDTRRAEDYFKSACKLDPSVAEEADEGRQQAIAKRRSRRQRAANTAAERRRSVVDGANVRRRSVMSGAAARRNSLMQGVGSARRGSILGGGGGDSSPGNSPGAAAAASAAAAGWSKGGGGSGPEAELEYMLERLSASLPSQPKDRQQRMVETLQAAVVEWQGIVAAEQPQPSAGDGDGGSSEQPQPAEGATAPQPAAGGGGGGGGGKGRRQRKKRGASAAAAVARPGDEDLGAFDALQALQSEHGWASNGADGSSGNGSGGEDGNGSESVATDSKPAESTEPASGEAAGGGGGGEAEGQIGLGISMGATLAEATEEEEAGTPRDSSSSGGGAAAGPRAAAEGGSDLGGVEESPDEPPSTPEQEHAVGSPARPDDAVAELLEEEGEDEEEEEEEEGDEDVLARGRLRSSRVSSSDLGALDGALEEGDEGEESDEDEDGKPLRRSRRNRASSKGVAPSLQSIEEPGS